MESSKTKTSILEETLKINLERLHLLYQMEKEKNFVYPEGTAITKVILQIEEELYIRKHGYNRTVQSTATEPKEKTTYF